VLHGNCERQNRKICDRAFPYIDNVSKKVHPFYFCDYSQSDMVTDLNSIAAEKICKQMTYSFLIISNLYMNITE